MTLARRSVLAVCAALIVAHAVRADHPNTARGFQFAKPYQMHGLDNINLFNGNLTVTLPIGQRYRVNGNLSYGLTLIYSGNVWDTVELDPTAGGQTRTYPSRRSNAGIGWYLTLGRLFPGNVPPVQETMGGEWQYETPDGALHAFKDSDGNYRYTDDGSYLRLTLGPTDRTVEFPDGTSQIFREMERIANGSWSDLPGTGVWRLRQIKDRFQNVVNITYSSADAAPPSEPAYPEVWTISDGSRTQKVYFIAATAPYELKADHVELTTFVGTSIWRMAYVDKPVGSGGPNGSGSIYTVPFLTSLTLPTTEAVTQVFSMLDGASQPNYIINTNVGDNYQTNGHLLGMGLPTGGALQWTYDKWLYYGSETGISRSVAVATRKIVSGPTTYTWSYTRSNSGQQTCTDPNTQQTATAAPNQLTVAVTSPEQVTSIHYFSVGNPASEVCGFTGFDDTQYGLPFTPVVESPSVTQGTAYLSREIFTGPTPALPSNFSTTYRVTVPPGGSRKRTEWVLYQFDGISTRNPRESASLTFFGDDATSCGGTCEYTGVRRYGWDSFGHYRQSSTEGNLPGAKYRTNFVNYPERTATGTWILNTFTERCTLDEADKRSTLLTGCNGITGASDSAVTATAFCFNAATGFLERTRTLGGRTASHQVGASADDLLAIYTSDGSGNVQREDYYGGDTQTIAGGVCTESLGLPRYSIEHTYESGSRMTSRYLPATGPTSPGFYAFNATSINANTGLIHQSKDVAGQETTYAYDAFGRVTTISPPGLASTMVSYPTATKAIATTTSAAGNEVKSENEFDAFGRLYEERRLMKDGTMAKRRTEYTGSGWVEKQYEWETTPTHYTQFTFDAFGRPLTVTRPDNTVTTIAYAGGSTITRTVSVAGASGPLSSVTTETYDGHGRLDSITEKSGVNGVEVKTGYTYDSGDRLTKICAGEANGQCQQERTFKYDGRGLLTEEKHPESGDQTTTYGGYDARGHVGHKYQGTASSGFDHKYEYDAAERLTKVQQLMSREPESTRLLKQFTFGTAADAVTFTQGRLMQALRHNYQIAAGGGDVKVTESYGYDVQGQVASKQTEIRSDNTLVQKFSQSYSYNNLGLLQTLTYPTCPEPTRPCGAATISNISPSYQNGFLDSVPNFATSIDYAANGMVKEIVHAGTTAMTDTIVADSNGMARPKQIKFQTYHGCTAPSIVQQPADASVGANGSTTLTVGAAPSSTTPLSYQWLREGVVVANQSSPSYFTGSLAVTTRYKVRVINSCGMVESREATVTVGGSSCSYILQPPAETFYSNATTATVNVVSGAGCAWAAVSNSGFLSITGGASGNGNGTVTFSVAQNTTASPRSGTITAGGQTFTVNQRAFAPVRGDFNVDSKVDVLWRNVNTGENVVWYLSNNVFLGGAAMQSLGTAWKLAGAADFNQDGLTDLVFRHSTTGENVVWFMNGTTYISSANLQTVPNANWTLEAIGDFTGDGKPDVVWHNHGNGLLTIWQMNGLTVTSAADLGIVSDLNWHVVGAADFNADGQTDLAWRHSANGSNVFWRMNGTSLVNGVEVDALPDNNWKIIAVGDYSGDGKSDLFWHNVASGNNGIWKISNFAFAGGLEVDGLPDLSWAGAGPR
jgi:FG-GAP-like repeat/RHS Repeat